MIVNEENFILHSLTSRIWCWTAMYSIVRGKRVRMKRAMKIMFSFDR